MSKKRKFRKKRGHPVGLLIGLTDNSAVFWRVFSETVKPDIIIKRGRKRRNQDEKQIYHFHEAIVDKLRPIIKEGIKSVLLASPPKKDYSKEFLEHINKHHLWLLKKGRYTAVFTEIIGLAKSIKNVNYLVRQDFFKEAVDQTSNQEGLLILEALDKLINKPNNYSKILYTVVEIEREIDKRWKSYEKKPSYIILTDEYIKNSRQKGRIHRILQIAKNQGIKTKIVNAESEAGIRVNNFGGLICFTKIDKKSSNFGSDV